MRENAQIIASEVRRLEHILREVLDYSNPAPLRPATFDLARVLHEAFDLLRWEMDDAGIRASLQVENGPLELRIDRNQIFQALINVMNNAIHAMAHGGALTVRMRQCPGWCEIAVSDTGPGIEPEALPRIFEPFFTTRSTGSGLGLTIARQIPKEQPRAIAAETTQGPGTTFIPRLPITPEGAGHAENLGG